MLSDPFYQAVACEGRFTFLMEWKMWVWIVLGVSAALLIFGGLMIFGAAAGSGLTWGSVVMFVPILGGAIYSLTHLSRARNGVIVWTVGLLTPFVSEVVYRSLLQG